MVLTAAATIGTGLTPARQAARVAMLPALTRSDSPRVGRLRAILVGTEVAVSLVLVVVTALLLRSMIRASMLDPGMPVDRLLTVRIDARLHGYEGARLDAILRGVRAELDTVPGVVASAFVNPAPFSGNRAGTIVRRADAADSPGVPLFLAEVQRASSRPRSSSWFAGDGSTIAGSKSRRQPDAGGRPVAGGDPLGAPLHRRRLQSPHARGRGVVRDSPYGALRTGAAVPVPARRRRNDPGRTAGPATDANRAAVEAVARSIAASADGRSVAEGIRAERTARQGIGGSRPGWDCWPCSSRSPASAPRPLSPSPNVPAKSGSAWRSAPGGAAP